MGKKAEQDTFDGMERVQNKKVAAKGRALRRAIDDWRELGREKKKATDALIATMRNEDVLHYIDDDANPPIEIRLTAKDEVKVKEWKGEKKQKPPEEEEDEADEKDAKH